MIRQGFWVLYTARGATHPHTSGGPPVPVWYMMAAQFTMWWFGGRPVNISYTVAPTDHTSLFGEKRRLLHTSGAMYHGVPIIDVVWAASPTTCAAEGERAGGGAGGNGHGIRGPATKTETAIFAHVTQSGIAPKHAFFFN